MTKQSIVNAASAKTRGAYCGARIACAFLGAATAIALLPSLAQAAAPTVTTTVPTNFTMTSTTVNGIVNPNGLATTSCWFEWGTSASFGTVVPCASDPGAGTEDVHVSAVVPVGMLPNTIYFMRLKVTNADGEGEGGTVPLITTAHGAAIPTTGGATDITETSATLHGTLDPNWLVTTCRFDYDTAPDYDAPSPYAHSVPVACPVDPQTWEAGDEMQLSATVEGLAPATTYRYRLTAVNSFHPFVGAEETFTTAGPVEEDPPVDPGEGGPIGSITGPAAGDGASTAATAKKKAATAKKKVCKTKKQKRTRACKKQAKSAKVKAAKRAKARKAKRASRR